MEMTTVLKYIPKIVTIAKTIYDINKQVKYNKKQCQRTTISVLVQSIEISFLVGLIKRIESIVNAIESSPHREFKDEISVETALKHLIEILEESLKFISQFTDSSILTRFIKNSDHELEFDELNRALLSSATDLNLSLNLKVLFDQKQDFEDQKEDLAEISSKIDLIALELTNQQKELVRLDKDMKNEFQRRFQSFRYHLQQDLIQVEKPPQQQQQMSKTEDFASIPLIAGYDLISEQQIGEGAFADVYRGTWLSHQHTVAIKILRVNYLNETTKQNFFDELSTMYKIRFDHVLGIFGGVIEPNYYALVLEFMSLGSLFDVLQKKEKILSWNDRWSIGLQMSKGLNYLHMMSIIHRDIKSLNFLMDIHPNGFIVKISDFGLAKIRLKSTQQVQRKEFVGTIQWTAPELFKFEQPSKSSDIFSLGIVFWELATQAIPYEHFNDNLIIEQVQNGQRLPIPKNIPQDFSSIINQCWNQDPKQRPNTQQIIQMINQRSKQIVTYQNEKLEQIIADSSSHSTLKLNQMNLTDSDIEFLVQQPIVNKQTTILWLIHNEISCRGAQLLSHVLFNNIHLQELWLTNNHLTDQGIYHLSKSLSVNSTLTKLGIASNEITNVGISYLVQMLKKNRTLTMIALANNEIGDEGIQLLSNTLAYYNSTLEILTLNRNPSITDRSIHSIVNMINKNKTIKQIWLNNCNLSQSGITKLNSFAQTKPSLKLVTVYQQSQ